MLLVSALRMTQFSTTPANPAAGVTAVYAKAGDILVQRSSAGVELPIEPGIPFVFSRAGSLVTGTGTARMYNDTGFTLAIKAIRASVGTAPTGASIIVDVLIGGTTIYGTPANRPTIAAAGNTSGKNTGYSTATIADGSYFTVSIVQIGSTVPGADLTVQILC